MRNFTNSIITPYKGAFGAQSITAHQKSTNAPQGVSITVPWYQYALQMNISGGVTIFNGGVAIDLTRSQVQAPLDIIKTVFIDNTAVDRPVYLRCEDTGQVITCSDNTFGYFPVITNGEQFTLFTDNIIPLRDGRQQTRLIFSNASFDTFGGSEYNRAQALYRASGTSQYTAPVLGDKLFSTVLNYPSFTTGATRNVPILPATPNSQMVVTGLSLINTNCYFGTNQLMTFNFKNGSNVWFTASVFGGTVNQNNITKFILAQLMNPQISVDATQGISLDLVYSDTANGYGLTADLAINYALITLPALS